MEATGILKKYDQFSDGELVKMFVQGDGNAFAVLINRHLSYTKLVISQFIKDKDEQEDVLQDLYEKVILILRKKQMYQETGIFRAWLLRICHNMCVDKLRYKRIRPTSSVDENPMLIVSKCVDQDTALTRMIKEEERVKLMGYIQSLPFDQREVLIMRYYLDLSFKEISDCLGININTALGRMNYSKKKLSVMLEAR